MSDTPVQPDHCPLCARPNECGMAAGNDTCWCFDAVIPPAVLDAVPPEARNRACICRDCASGSDASSSRPR